jgi:hypothetical protein
MSRAVAVDVVFCTPPTFKTLDSENFGFLSLLGQLDVPRTQNFGIRNLYIWCLPPPIQVLKVLRSMGN